MNRKTMNKRTDFIIKALPWIVIVVTIIGFVFGVIITNIIAQKEEGNKILSCFIDTSRLTLSAIGEYCEAHTPDGYKLYTWWDGCSTIDENITFQCGYINSDGAIKYNCYDVEELLKEE